MQFSWLFAKVYPRQSFPLYGIYIHTHYAIGVATNIKYNVSLARNGTKVASTLESATNPRVYWLKNTTKPDLHDILFIFRYLTTLSELQLLVASCI